MIKTDKLIRKDYDRKTGKVLTEISTTYVCEACQSLVQFGDKYCYHCGKLLGLVNKRDYFISKKQVTNTEFQAAKDSKIKLEK